MRSDEWLSWKPQKEKVTHKFKHTQLSTFEVFVLLQCWWCVINTLKIDTEQLQHINVFTGGVQKNTSQLAHNWLVSVNISYCCLSWSLTVTPSQCTLQMHIHCYKSHVHEWLYLHYGCSFCTIDMNNRSSKKHDSGFTHECLSVHELDSLKLHILPSITYGWYSGYMAASMTSSVRRWDALEHSRHSSKCKRLLALFHIFRENRTKQ